MTAAVTGYKRGHRRGHAVVDVSAFRPVIDQAMEAFQADVTYAVHMARAAVTIARKRELWQARRETQ